MIYLDIFTKRFKMEKNWLENIMTDNFVQTA